MAIYLIPCPISEHGIETIPPSTLKTLHKIDYFIVERAKTARRFIKESGHPKPLQELNIFEINKHDPQEGLIQYLTGNANIHDIGVISEAGCPGIADPGSRIVSWAQDQENIPVIPLVGPSSILLAIMGSGFNGQQFTFHGYLPHDKGKLIKKLRWIELDVQKNGNTHIFIETPYRNRNLLSTVCSSLRSSTLMAIAVDLTHSDQEVKTKTIESWKKVDAQYLHKRPAVFCIGRSS
jgi:16S rRNA (cytidine1402-2'-O)-methyltransferase